MKRLALAVALLLIAAPVVAWQPTSELPTAQQRLERLDRDLLPIQGALMASFEDYLAAPSSLDDEYLTIIQTRAIQGWERVRAEPWDECMGQYLASLRVGFSLIADSIDNFRVLDPAYQAEAGAGWLLLGERATRERSLTTCAGVAATPAHTPIPTPTATPGATARATPTAEPT